MVEAEESSGRSSSYDKHTPALLASPFTGVRATRCGVTRPPSVSPGEQCGHRQSTSGSSDALLSSVFSTGGLGAVTESTRVSGTG